MCTVTMRCLPASSCSELHLHIVVYNRRLQRNLGEVTQGFQGCLTSMHDAQANINFILRNTREAAIADGRNIGELWNSNKNDGQHNYICLLYFVS